MQNTVDVSWKPERLTMLRTQHHHSKSELARYLGVTRVIVTLWENGKRRPNKKHMKMIADLYSVHPYYLYGYDQHIPKVPEENERIYIQLQVPVEKEVFEVLYNVLSKRNISVEYFLSRLISSYGDYLLRHDSNIPEITRKTI